MPSQINTYTEKQEKNNEKLNTFCSAYITLGP